MALDEKPPAPPPPPLPPPPPPPPPLPPPPPRSISLHPVRLHGQEEGAIVEAGDKAAALWRSRSESPWSPPHGRLPESGCRHEGGASSSRNMEPPLGPSAGVHQREEPAVQQGGSPQLRLCEAHCLLQDAAAACVGVIAGEPPCTCTKCSLTLGLEKKMQGHERWLPRRRSTTPSSSSSSEEAPTPKKARNKLEPEPATVKMEPRHEEPPLPFPMARGATSRRSRSPPIHAENPEVTAYESTATVRNVIVIDDDSDDGENAVNVSAGCGGNGNANPAVAAVTGFGATARSAPDAAPAMPVARARRAPAAAIEVIVIDDDSSDDDNAVNVNDAEAVLPLPMPRAPAAPIADDTVKGKNAIHEASARYSNGGHGKAVAGHSNAGHLKAGAGSSSGGSGSGKAIAIGGQSKRGSGSTNSCADCDETFDTPQALGGHANRHRYREKKSMATPGLQSAASTACGSGRYVFPTGQALGWHRKRVIGSASNAGSSSAPRPAAAEVPSEATAMTNRNANAAATHGPADAMHRRSFPAPAGNDAILALLALSPVARRMAMAGSPVAGLVSAAATAATGSWSLTAASSSVVPAIPLQNQGVNPPGENVAVPGNRRGRAIRIRIFGVDHFPALSTQNPPQAAAVAPGGTGEQSSIRLFGSDVSPGFPSQNQEGNPPQETVPGNRGPHTIRVFGVDMSEGSKEPKK